MESALSLSVEWLPKYGTVLALPFDRKLHAAPSNRGEALSPLSLAGPLIYETQCSNRY
jgi:hypothetical protein